MDERITRLAELITAQTFGRLQADCRPSTPEIMADWHHKDAQAHIRPGAKYIKIDVGSSGKYMIDGDNIYGCKGYGVIHRGHQYGTLDTIDDYYWGGYVAVRQNKGR